MFEEYFPLMYAGIAGTCIAVFIKGMWSFQTAKLKIITKVQRADEKPDASVDKFFDMVENAPQYLTVAKKELADIRAKNPTADLKNQEWEIKMLEGLAKYNKPLSMAAPFVKPIAKRWVNSIAKGELGI